MVRVVQGNGPQDLFQQEGCGLSSGQILPCEGGCRDPRRHQLAGEDVCVQPAVQIKRVCTLSDPWAPGVSDDDNYSSRGRPAGDTRLYETERAGAAREIFWGRRVQDPWLRRIPEEIQRHVVAQAAFQEDYL